MGLLRDAALRGGQPPPCSFWLLFSAFTRDGCCFKLLCPSQPFSLDWPNQSCRLPGMALVASRGDDGSTRVTSPLRFKLSVTRKPIFMGFGCAYLHAWYALILVAWISWFYLKAVGLAIYEGVNRFLDEKQPVVLHRQARWHDVNQVADKLDLSRGKKHSIQNHSPLPCRTNG